MEFVGKYKNNTKVLVLNRGGHCGVEFGFFECNAVGENQLVIDHN